MSVTIITATLPERAALLKRATDSVAEQLLKPDAHTIVYDYAKKGGAYTKNLACSTVRTKWIALLDDDDYLYPNHLERLVSLAESSNADVAYSPDDGAKMYREGFSPDRLRSGSIVSHNALVRAELFKELGGFEIIHGYDWSFWVRALNTGAKFVRTDEVTWFYDLSNEWKHESR